MTWLRHCTVVRLPSGRKNNLQHHSSSCLFLELFSSLEGNWNIRCSFVFETATSHRPFLTLSAFHLRTVMFTVLLAWRQPLFSSAHSTAFLFLEFSIDGCLHFHWLPSYLSYQPRLKTIFIWTYTAVSLYWHLTFLTLKYIHALDRRKYFACSGQGYCSAVI